MTECGGRLYAIGGCAEVGEDDCTVESYDPNTDLWTPCPGLPGHIKDLFVKKYSFSTLLLSINLILSVNNNLPTLVGVYINTMKTTTVEFLNFGHPLSKTNQKKCV